MHPFFAQMMSGLLAQTRFNAELLFHAGTLQAQFLVGMVNLQSELLSLAYTTRARRAIYNIESSSNGGHQVVFAAFGERRLPSV